MKLLKKMKRRSKENEMLITLQAFDITTPGYTRLSDNAEVKIAIDRIADMVSNMSIHLMRNTDKGDVRMKDELARKIDVHPCRGMTRKTWLYAIVQSLLLEGNAIVLPVTKEGLIRELIPLPNSEWSFTKMEGVRYWVQYNNKLFSNEEVVHFAINPNTANPFMGTGYALSLREIIQNLKQANEVKKKFMSGKFMPQVIIKVDAETEEIASEAGRKIIEEKYLNREEAGAPWIIPAELLSIEQVKPLSLTDIALKDGVELDKKTVAGLIGVPAFFLGVGSFNQQEYNNFVNTRIMSIAQVIAQTLTRDILYSPDMYFKLNPRSLYAYDMKDMVAAGVTLVKSNCMRRNELRGWIDLPHDEEMEPLLVLENFLNQEDLGNQGKLKGGEENAEG